MLFLIVCPIRLTQTQLPRAHVSAFFVVCKTTSAMMLHKAHTARQYACPPPKSIMPALARTHARTNAVPGTALWCLLLRAEQGAGAGVRGRSAWRVRGSCDCDGTPGPHDESGQAARGISGRARVSCQTGSGSHPALLCCGPRHTPYVVSCSVHC